MCVGHNTAAAKMEPQRVHVPLDNCRKVVLSGSTPVLSNIPFRTPLLDGDVIVGTLVPGNGKFKTVSAWALKQTWDEAIEEGLKYAKVEPLQSVIPGSIQAMPHIDKADKRRFRFRRQKVFKVAEGTLEELLPMWRELTKPNITAFVRNRGWVEVPNPFIATADVSDVAKAKDEEDAKAIAA